MELSKMFSRVLALVGNNMNMQALVGDSVREVAGYEFPADLEFCREAVYILEHLSRRGCVYFQVDDGHHPELAQLKEAAEQQYFIFVKLNDHEYLIAEHDKWRIEVESSEMVA